MPRQARLDAPSALHHVLVRGLEREKIVADRQDRADFVARLGAVAGATRTTIYARVLLPTRAHLLLQSGPQGLPTFMRRVPTGSPISTAVMGSWGGCPAAAQSAAGQMYRLPCIPEPERPQRSRRR